MADFITIPRDPNLYLLIIATGFALVYLLFRLEHPPSAFRSITKTLPLIFLAMAALISGQSFLLVLALSSCALGDYFLSREGDPNFLFGLTAFLAGHVFYIGFFAQFLAVGSLISTDAGLNLALLTALCIMVLIRLWPFLQEMRLPVIVYMAAIVAMAITARAANPGFPVLAGIALFIVSDIILAFDKFTPLAIGLKRRTMPYLVWIFYFSGQLLLVYGLIMNG